MPNGERGMAGGGGGSEDVLYLEQQQGPTLFHLKNILASKQKTVNQKIILKILIWLVRFNYMDSITSIPSNGIFRRLKFANSWLLSSTINYGLVFILTKRYLQTQRLQNSEL